MIDDLHPHILLVDDLPPERYEQLRTALRGIMLSDKSTKKNA